MREGDAKIKADDWFKVVAIILHKHRKQLGAEITISNEDVAALNASKLRLVCFSGNGRYRIGLVSDAQYADIEKKYEEIK